MQLQDSLKFMLKLSNIDVMKRVEATSWRHVRH